MSVLENPVIPFVVRWSARAANLEIENLRTAESIRPDRLAHAESACQILDERWRPIIAKLVNAPMSDAAARDLVAHLQRVADDVTRETEVMFVVQLETDADRDAAEVRDRYPRLFGALADGWKAADDD